MSAPKTDEYEICVLCKAKTDVLRSTPIEFRSNYIVGCGQLCHNCAGKIKAELNQVEADVSISEIEELINILKKK